MIRVGAGVVEGGVGTLVVARGGAALGENMGTTGDHKGPHSTQLYPRPYATHDGVQKNLPLKGPQGSPLPL